MQMMAHNPEDSHTMGGPSKAVAKEFIKKTSKKKRMKWSKKSHNPGHSEAIAEGVPESDIARIESDIKFRKDIISKTPKVSFDDHMKRVTEDFQHK